MGVFAGIAIALGCLLMIVLLRSLTTFFHELGHAIPALWFTKEAVEVYVGSYGDLEGSVSFRLGRLHLFLRWNPFDWKLGMCRHKGGMVAWQQLIVTLGGPLASVLLAGIGLYVIVNFQLSDTWLYLVAIFAAAATIDLWVNLTPNDRELMMHDGQVLYSDGYHIRDIIRQISLPDSYHEAEQAFEDGQLESCKLKCEALLEDGVHKKKVYELYWAVLQKEKDYSGVLELYHRYREHFKLLPWDYYQIADAYEQLGQPLEALKYFDHYLYLQYANPHVHYRKARIHVGQADFWEAVKELDFALEITEGDLLAYSLKAYCMFRLGKLEECRHYLNLARQMEGAEEVAALHYYEGLYLEETGEKQQALTAFQQAQARGFEYHGLPMKIDELERMLGGD